ncbi:hypothetical protein M9434_001228 [Picochlorum sp. BPE23]|nr:hypothetical protein M9434_001228 [Picochlorum sp. BPE23]
MRVAARQSLCHGRSENAALLVLGSSTHAPPASFMRSMHARKSKEYSINSKDGETDDAIQKAVSEMLESNPESMKRITDAANKVAELQMEQQRLIDEMKALEGEDEGQGVVLAEAEAAGLIAEAEAQAAELLLKAAELQAASAKAERMEGEGEINRIESIKAGVFSGVGGCLSTLPFVFASADASRVGILANLGVVAVSSFLFGVVYRYAVRSDVRNTQLKGGVVGAFGLVRGLSMAQEVVGAGSGGYSSLPGVDVMGEAAIVMGQSMILFGFCSAALEFAARNSWVELGHDDGHQL